MGKEILILTGSPRHGGNSDLLAAAFQKGAEAAGHSVTQFATASKKFYPCLACDTCWSQGRPCSIKDDFNGLANLLEAADLIVFATPLYWFTFPSNLKAVIDKFYAYESSSSPVSLHGKDCALLLVGGAEDVSDFDAAVGVYQNIAHYLQWQDQGVLLATGVNDKGEITKTSFLAQAEEMGRNIR